MGIDVAIANAGREVEAKFGNGQRHTLGDALAPDDRHLQNGSVCRPERAAVFDDHIGPTSDRSDETDVPVGHCSHCVTAGDSVFKTSIAGPVPMGWWPKPVDHLGVHRCLPGARGGGR